MADWSKPTTASTYTNFVAEVAGRDTDILLGLDPALLTPTNVPANAIRWTSAGNKWQKYNGTTWADLSSLYAINISGNAATATSATTATKLAGGAAGSVVFQSAVGTTGFSAAGTAGQVLLSGGTGAPTWATQASLSVGTAATCTGNAATATTAAACSGNAATATTANALNASNSYTVTGITATAGGIIGGANSAISLALYAVNIVRGFLYADAGGVGFLSNGGGWAARVNYGTSDFLVWGNITAFSDENVKTNWRSLGNDFVVKLAGVKSGIYDRTDQELTQVGVSAQSLREVMPDAVLQDEKGVLSVAYGNAALAACVELAKVVVELQEKIAAMEARQ